MTNARIASVSGYDQCRSLAQAAREALTADPSISEMLAKSLPSRLIVVKPNWVQQFHEHCPGLWEPVITHPAVVLAVVDQLVGQLNTIQASLHQPLGGDFSQPIIDLYRDMIPVAETTKASHRKLEREE